MVRKHMTKQPGCRLTDKECNFGIILEEEVKQIFRIHIWPIIESDGYLTRYDAVLDTSCVDPSVSHISYFGSWNAACRSTCWDHVAIACWTVLQLAVRSSTVI
jgi:hypothetical protein